MRITDRTILITGGAGGIGMALSWAFVQRGNTVIICGRSQERLDDAAKAIPGLVTRQCDLTDLDAVRSLAAWLAEEHPSLDVVINNAAVTHLVDIHDGGAPTMIGDDVQANIMGTVNTSLCLLPLLERQPQACLAIVTSGIAYAPAPDAMGYSLTKAALNSFARSLRSKLRGTGVKVVEIVPPAVDTEMIRDLRCRKMSVDAVAARVLAGLAHNRSNIRMGQTHVTHIVNRIWPRGAELIIAASFD